MSLINNRVLLLVVVSSPSYLKIMNLYTLFNAHHSMQTPSNHVYLGSISIVITCGIHLCVQKFRGSFPLKE